MTVGQIKAVVFGGIAVTFLIASRFSDKQNVQGLCYAIVPFCIGFLASIPFVDA